MITVLNDILAGNEQDSPAREYLKMPKCGITKNEDGVVVDIYITKAIDDPQYFSKAVGIIDTLSENDTVHIWLDTPGGNLITAQYLSLSLITTPALTVGHAIGSVMSAGTYVLLHCRKLEIEDSAAFMFHNASVGLQGKVKNIYNYVDALTSQMEDYIDLAMKKGLLTGEEKERILQNRNEDLYLSGREIKKRLEVKTDEQ